MYFIPCRTSWKLKQVSKNKDNTFGLTYDTPDGQKQIKTRSVALTVPAYIAADLIQQDCATAAQKLRGFDYPPVAAISLAYPMSSIRDDRKDKAGEVPGESWLLWTQLRCVAQATAATAAAAVPGDLACCCCNLLLLLVVMLLLQSIAAAGGDAAAAAAAVICCCSCHFCYFSCCSAAVLVGVAAVSRSVSAQTVPLNDGGSHPR